MYGLVPRVHASPADQIIIAVFLMKTKNPVLSSSRGPMQSNEQKRPPLRDQKERFS